jgi:hypothetical protein
VRVFFQLLLGGDLFTRKLFLFGGFFFELR